MRLIWMYHVMHNICTMHGRDIKTKYIGSTSILLLRKDCSSIRLDRTQLFFRKHFQLIVFQKLSDWKLEKSYTKKYTCHFDLHQRSHWSTNGKENWVRKLLDNQKVKLLDNQKEKLFHKQIFSNQPNQLQIQVVKDQERPDKMQDGRNTYRSQEINVNSFCEELSSSDRTGRLVETDVIQTRSSEDRESLNVEQTRERTGRPAATLHTAEAQDSSRVRSAHKSDTFTLMMKYFVEDWKNPLLIMMRIMNQWWWTRQTWTSEFQDYHLPLWNTAQSTSVRQLDSENWEPPRSTCSSTWSTTESIV